MYAKSKEKKNLSVDSSMFSACPVRIELINHNAQLVHANMNQATNKGLGLNKGEPLEHND